MSQRQYPKPLPHLIPLNRPFWEAAREGRLSVQRCSACSTLVFFPRPFCPHCYSSALEWVSLSGQGRVYSFTIVRRPTVRGFESEAPYVFAIVELEEGVRLVSNIVGCAPEQVQVGMPVTAVFRPATEEITLPLFRAVEPGSR